MLKRFTTVLLCMSLVFGLFVNVMAEEPVSPNPNPIEDAESKEEPEEEDISAFGLTPSGEGQSGSNVIKVYDGFVTLTDQQLAAVNAEYGDNVSKKRKEEIAAFISQQGLGTIIETLDTEKPVFEGVTYENYEKGKVYSVGDKIKIKLKFSDNVGVSGVKLYLKAQVEYGSEGGKVASIDYVSDEYNEKSDTWDYELEMKENMYPGEWRISMVHAYDTSNNRLTVNEDSYDDTTHSYVKNFDMSVVLNYEYEEQIIIQ